MTPATALHAKGPRCCGDRRLRWPRPPGDRPQDASPPGGVGDIRAGVSGHILEVPLWPVSLSSRT